MKKILNCTVAIVLSIFFGFSSLLNYDLKIAFGEELPTPAAHYLTEEQASTAGQLANGYEIPNAIAESSFVAGKVVTDDLDKRVETRETSGVKAFFFNGAQKSGTTPEKNGYAQFPVDLTNASASISLWLKPQLPNVFPGTTPTGVILQGAKTILNYVPIKAGNFTMRSPIIKGEDLQVGGSAKISEFDKWLNVIITFDKESAKTAVYINGEVASTTTSASLDSSVLSTLILGRHSGDEQINYHYKGYAKDLKIYTQKLSDSQAQSIFASEKTGYNLTDTEPTPTPTPTPTTPPTEPAEKTVKVYDFETIVGNQIKDSEGNAVGEIFDSVTQVDGIHGKALYLSGSSWARITETRNLQEGSFAFSLWVNPDSGSFDSQVFSRPRSLVHQFINDKTGKNILSLLPSPMGAVSTYIDGKSVNSKDIVVEPDKWNHVAMSIDVTNKTIMVFVNGILASESVLDPTKIASGDTMLNLGKHRLGDTGAGSLNYVGIIDDLTFYNYAISQEEMMDSYYGDMPIEMINQGVQDGISKWNTLSAAGKFPGFCTKVNNFIATYSNELGREEKIQFLKDLQAEISEYDSKLEFSALLESLSEHSTKLGSLIDQIKNEESKTAVQSAKTALENAIAIDDETIENYTLAELAEKITEINSLKETLDTAINSASLTIISVDTTKVTGAINRAIYGANHRYASNLVTNEWSLNGYGSYDFENDKTYDELQTILNEMNLGTIRYPGGTAANLFQWKRAINMPNLPELISAGYRAIDDAKDRIPTLHGNARIPIYAEYGIDESLQSIEKSGSETVYVYNIGNGNIQDYLDLLEYLNCPNDGSNFGGGIDWAKVRATNGHETPYNVTKFEMGNEYYLDGQKYWTIGAGSAKKYANGGEISFKNDYTQLKGSYLTPYLVVNDTCNYDEETGLYDTDWSDKAAKSDGSPNQIKFIRYRPVKEGSAQILKDMTKSEVADNVGVTTIDDVTVTFEVPNGVTKVLAGLGISNGQKEALTAKVPQGYKGTQTVFTLKTVGETTLKTNVSISFNGSSSKKYVVLHEKSNGTIEEIEATFAGGKLSFSVKDFSPFMVVEKTNRAPSVDDGWVPNFKGNDPTPAPTPTVKPTPAPTQTPAPTPVPETPIDESSSNLWWLWVLIPVVIVGGATAVYLIKKKKNN